MTTQTLIQLGEPVEHRAVVIAPLFPRQRPRADYVTLDEALALGFRVTGVSDQGSVPEVLAVNRSALDVLLCDGEEIVGAKQNRILNVTVLVAAASKVRIPVSCVEQGRWSRGSGAFSTASQTAYPELRRRKAERLAAAPLRLGAAQDEVWDAVAEKSVRLGAYSPTGAQTHIFASRGRELDGLRGAFPLEPGQSGALVASAPTSSASTTPRSRRPSHGSTRSFSTATCSTPSSGWTGSLRAAGGWSLSWRRRWTRRGGGSPRSGSARTCACR